MDINLEKLPSIPHTLVKLTQAFNDPEVDFIQVSGIIQKDPSLLSKILNLCNSACYAQCSFKDFEHMLVVLGLDNVKSIATTAAVQQFFSQFNSDANDEISEFWISSLKAAFFAKEIAKIIDYPYPEEAYLGGLIHQIGKLIYLSQSGPEYKELLTHCKTEIELVEKEIELYKQSSAQLGAQLVQSWNINSIIDDAILYQNVPIIKLFDSHLLIRIINLSHKFCIQKSAVDDNTNTKPELLDTSYKLFGLSQELIEKVLMSVQDNVAKTAIGLDIKFDNTTKKITNTEEYCLALASKVKHIALQGSIAHQKNTEIKPQQVITNLMQNVHLIFGLNKSFYFSFDASEKKLYCSASNLNTQSDSSHFSISLTGSHDEHPVLPSILNKAFKNRSITSSFETNFDSLTIVDQQIIKKLGADGILCIPLFYQSNKKNNTEQDFFGILVVAVSEQQYPKLIAQRTLIADFTHTAARNLNKIKIINQQHNETIENSSKEQNLFIRKLIHEANNPLAIITNYLHVLSLKMKKLTDADNQSSHTTDFDKVNSQIETLQDEVERVGHILLRMKEPPQYSHNSIENTSINELIKSLLSVFENSLFELNKVRSIVSYDQTIPSISCDSSKLKQVLINLIKNSVEALAESSLNSAEQVIENPTISIKTDDCYNMNGKQYVKIGIADNGPGMSKDVLENLFSPVQTSKGLNHSGLGLSICKKMIDQLGGVISCSSNPMSTTEHGVKFDILLPRQIIEETT